MKFHMIAAVGLVGFLVACISLSSGCSGAIRNVRPAQIKITKKIVQGTGKDAVPMVYVPAGAFMRGSPTGRGEDDQKPQRSITLNAFYIDQYAVSMAHYRRCVEAGSCTEPNKDEICNWGVDGREDHPINCVSWHQSKGYCEWVGKRLPTEAEWEKSAKGNDGRLFSWGNELPSCELTNYNASSQMGQDKYCHGRTIPVGEYPGAASPYGVVQMTGNVYQWASDWYGKTYYQESPDKNPQGPTSGKYRIVRGGSWFNVARDLKVELRGLIPPGTRLNYVGFRCAKN